MSEDDKTSDLPNNLLQPELQPVQSETWSTMHMLALDSTKFSGQAQTATLALGRGKSVLYSSGDIVDGSYRLLSLLGSGGMGVVFRCQHLILGKEYALKLLAADKLSPESWTRFQSEAKALARLHHPGVVGIHNMGIDNEQCPYYVMDLLSGESLSQMIKRKHRLPLKQALNLFIQLADALDAAHQQGIIHRDIKPSNVMVYEENQAEKVKLVDFGIARLSSRSPNSNIGGDIGSDVDSKLNNAFNRAFNSQNQTVAGAVIGTPYYMSPEQGLGQSVDHRSDIYSLGCALFEALTGIPPLCGANAMETLIMHQTEEAPSISSVYPDGKFPDSIDTAIAKMLRKDISQRYQSMKQVSHDLTRVREGKSVVYSLAKTASSNDSKNQVSENEDSESDVGKIISGGQRRLLISCFCLVIVAAGICFVAFTATKTTTSPTAKTVTATDIDPSDHLGLKAIAARIAGDLIAPDVALKQAIEQDESFVATSSLSGLATRQYSFPGFLGYMRIGNSPLQKAIDSVDVPIGEKVSLYLHCGLADLPEVCNKFGKDDISHLEVITNQPERVINILKGWTGLKHLSFSHTTRGLRGRSKSILLKSHLAMLNQLTTLHSLGLVGELSKNGPEPGAKVSTESIVGADIARLKLLSTLSALSLDAIPNVQPVFSEVSKHRNLKELFLTDLSIHDNDLKLLEPANNIETLQLFRCPMLTDKAYAYLCQMKGLKQLYTDIEWSGAVKRKFAKHPNFRYEPYDEGRDTLFGKRHGSIKENSPEFPRAINLHFDYEKHSKKASELLKDDESDFLIKTIGK